MIDLDQATIESIVIHKIGCKAADNNDARRENFYSTKEIQIFDEPTNFILKSYFSLALKSPDLYQFREPNTSVQGQAVRIFQEKANLHDASIKMAEKLFDVLNEQEESRSEFYVAYIKDCIVDDQTVDAVGIFQSESKDIFLKIFQNENEINFQPDEGINIKKLDKGCIIFNIQQDNGYLLKIQDNTKDPETIWTDKFLEGKVTENEYFNTESFLKICKEFNEEVLAKNDTVKNEDRIKFLQNSLNYFQTNETFDEQQFTEETIGNQQVIDDFNNFKQHYRRNNEIEAPEKFDIDPYAVKKSKKYLKSVIKLDKNFHIYVHSAPNNLERGYDEEKNKKFYKVFFDVES